MTYILTISEAAESDIRNAFLWYEEQKSGLGEVFHFHFSNSINSILENPYKIQIRYLDIRIAFLNIFPYGIHYRVNENEIMIVSVYHTSQNPDKWKG